MALKPTTKRPKENEEMTKKNEEAPESQATDTTPDSPPAEPEVPMSERSVRLGKYNWKPDLTVTEEFRRGLASQLKLPAGELPTRSDVEAYLGKAVKAAVDAAAAQGDDFVIKELQERLRLAQEAKRARAQAA